MGNKNTMKFEYNDFLQLTKEQKIQEFNTQQDLLQQFQCMVVHHKKKSIEGICMNEICRQENRRTCFDCIIDKTHDNDHGKLSLIRNADQAESIIQEFKIIMNNRIDNCQFQFYFEQLEICDERDENQAYIKFQKINKISSSIQQLQSLSAEINFKNYLSEQYKENTGLFQYLKDFNQKIIKVQDQIIEYKSIKNEIKQSTKLKEDFQVEDSVFKEMQAIKKKKIQIRELIMETKEFKNENISNNQKEYLIKNIEFMNQSIDQKNKDQITQNINLLYKLYPKDADYYYYNKGNSLSLMQQYQQANVMYDLAIQLNPQEII